MLESYQEFRITVRQFLTKPNPKYPDRQPVPMRVMFGYILEETGKGVKVSMCGKPEPSSVCLWCGRTLTHPVSLLYGIGPECGGHFHVNPLKDEAELETFMAVLKERMADIEWCGWLPKDFVTFEPTGVVNQIEVEEKEVEEIIPQKAPVFNEAPPAVHVDMKLVSTLIKELRMGG